MKSKATQNTLAHTQALLTLLQLHQHKELCYQLYLYAEALEGAILGGVTSELTGGKFGNGTTTGVFQFIFITHYMSQILTKKSTYC